MGRLIQFHPSVTGRDAVGNEVLALHRAAVQAGMQSRICALESASIEGESITAVTRFDIRPSDTLLLHYSLGHDVYEELAAAQCASKLMLYHDVTPPHLLAGAPREMVDAARDGLQRCGEIASEMDAAAAHSHHSAAALRSRSGPEAAVIPYLLRDDLLTRPADPSVAAQSKLGFRTLLAVGRVLPHKRIEDILMVYDYLRRISADQWRLIIAGPSGLAPGYTTRLRDLIQRMGLPRVTLTGSVPQSSINAWYGLADAFISMSEHEGFCVPLLEAMHFRVPIFARAAAAVPETLRGGGLCFDTSDWPAIAEAIDESAMNPRFRTQLLDAQDEALAAFSPDLVAPVWIQWIEGIRPIQYPISSRSGRELSAPVATTFAKGGRSHPI